AMKPVASTGTSGMTLGWDTAAYLAAIGIGVVTVGVVLLLVRPKRSRRGRAPPRPGRPSGSPPAGRT
ncbi:MAG TPA: hypothetical protein VFF67_02940, partial [Thermoplasmata archaeon]|nr:hypothetical protein [Thermoplasmata archaeon]